MFQFAFDRVLFRLNAKAPHMALLLQLPPTRAKWHSVYPYKEGRGFSPLASQFTLLALRCKWFQRKGRAEVPVRIRQRVGQIERKSTAHGTVVAAAAHKSKAASCRRIACVSVVS